MKIGIIACSDKEYEGRSENRSAAALAEVAKASGAEIGQVLVLPDNLDQTKTALMHLADNDSCDVILVAGGSGLSIEHVVPEATVDVTDRLVSGITRLIHMEAMKFSREAALSRALTGIRGNTLIINLPGDERVVVEVLKSVIDLLPTAVERINIYE